MMLCVDHCAGRLTRPLEELGSTCKQSVDSSSAEVEQAAVQLVSSLPEETLCKVLANRERVRDWIHDFFSSLPKLCDDPSNIVAAAAFSAIEALLREHPLCETAVDKEVRGFWGLESDVQPEGKGGVKEGRGSRGTPGGMFGGHKQAFPLQHVGEIVLRSALPRIRRLLHRQSRMVVDGEPQTAAPAMRACASVMVAALRLSTSPSGKPIENPLLQNPTSVDFLGVKKSALGSGPSGNDAGAEGSTGKEEEKDLDATLPPKDLAEEWLRARLGGILEGGRGGDALLVETAAWATLRVLHTVAMGPLRVSFAPRVAEAFLRVLVAGKAATPKHLWPSLHAGHQEVAAGAALALRLASPSATAALAPHVLAAAERVPQPRQRLALLADVFFLLLVRPGRNGRAPCVGGGSGSGGGERNDDRQGGEGGTGSSRTGAPREGPKMLASVLDEEWFEQLVSDSPGRSARRLLFREEAVAVLVTTCAQVLAAGVVAALSPAAEKAAAVGIGNLARSCDSRCRATAARSDTSEGHKNGSSVGNGNANFAASVSAAAAARAAAAAKKGRWSDLETWLDCSLTALEAFTRCVNWNSKTGYVGGLAYVRLLSLVLRLLCPLTAAPADSGDDRDSASTADRVLLGGRSYGGDGKGGVDVGVALDDDSTAGGGRGRLAWARQRLAHVVDDLMWRLREGLPGRDIRLRLLQATCTHVGLSAVVSGDVGVTEDSANELVSVLQGELGELDAQAGFSTQPRPARAATSGGDEPGDGDDGHRGTDAHAGRGGGSSGSPAAGGGGGGGGGAAAPQGQGGDDGGAGREAGGGGQWESISSISGRTGSLTDVMAHELVIGCLVRLALVTEGETAHEVMSVLEHERGRARARERLGRGAVGPMEEIVAKGIRALQLLVFPSTSPKVADGSPEAVLLKRLVRTMDLGWHAVVQPDERALTGSSAELFDHEVHAFPNLHRRLRRLLCGGIGVDTASTDERPSTGSGDFPGDLEAGAAAVITPFEAHAWEEEAPQAQLNGGSDPVVVTASHIVYHGDSGTGGGACGATGGGGRALGPTTLAALAFAGVDGDAASPGTIPGLVGKVASRAVTLRIRVFNATNTRLHGFSIRLSFGQGGEAVGMGGGGRVESAVQEVLMPSAAHTLEVPVTPLDVLTDVIVHVSVVFPDTEPESEFESEGTAELLGVESTEKGRGGDSGGGGSNALSGFGQNQPSFDGGAGDTGVDGGGSGSVTVILQAGSYRVPAEAFLGPPERAAATWVGFQNVWCGLAYVTAIPVESARHLPRAITAAAGHEHAAMSLRTASGVRLAMMPVSSRGGGGRGCDDARSAAAVECPVGNTDYAVSSAWVFQAWDGTPVLCALTVMKAPFSLLQASGGGGKGRGGGGEQPSWYGRLERAGVFATDAANFKPLARVLRDQQRVDTTQPATAQPERA
ncbi:expressed unknown protein [Ectocarpus siliculosus]|uniref:Uncharacterized protein n=1 Tax=Ectocarpus siliculosus TaxID=2880 RepID=D7G501_ECTSI|nr:expressed unknown protein [Ectocarpus siliculosus]|eukprot:CBJ33764.1 expressed unknown protein [Ectocarpus siliculosus]